MPGPMMASDAHNPNFIGAHNPDSLLWVQFERQSERNNFESEKQGKPVFREKIVCIIQPAGTGLLRVVQEVNESHKRRFPLHWAAFQAAQGPGEAVVGTIVEEWPALTRTQAEELKAAKFYTVEQIAGCSDQQLQTLGMNGPMLRQKARAFLDVAKDTALAQSQAAELARKDQELADLKADQKRLADQVAQLLAAQSPRETLHAKK